MTKAPTTTPWGHCKEIDQREQAEGLVWVLTPSHGGLWVAPELTQAMPPEMLKASMNAAGWFEEDHDWAIVVLCFADLFSDEQCSDAWRTIKGTARFEMAKAKWEPILDRMMNDPTCKLFHEKADRHDESVKDMWSRGSMGSLRQSERDTFPIGWWSVMFRHNSSGRHESICCDYPRKRYFTDQEIAEMKQAESLARSKFLAEKPEKHQSGFPQHSVVRGNSYAFEPSDADPGL